MCVAGNRHASILVFPGSRLTIPCAEGRGLDHKQYARSARLLLLPQIPGWHNGANTNAALGTSHNVQSARSSDFHDCSDGERHLVGPKVMPLRTSNPVIELALKGAAKLPF